MSDRATTWAWQQQPSSDKAWLALILLANVADEEGRVSFRRKEFAEMLRCSVDTFDRRIASLKDDGLMSVEADITIQGRGPNTYVLAIPQEFARITPPGRNSAATPKTAATPSRKTAATKAETTQQNGVAAKLRLAAPVAAAIKKPKEEIYTSKVEVVSSVASRAKRAPKRTPFDIRWTHLSEDKREYANRHGFLNGSADALFERFRLHHLAKGTTMANWDAAWQGWVRRAVEYGEVKNGNADHHAKRFGDGDARAERQRGALAALEEFEAMETQRTPSQRRLPV